MKLKTLLASTLVSLFAISAFAQHDHGQAAQQKPAAMDPAMMEAMMKASMPGEPHKKLDAFVGTWDTKVTFWMGPGMDAMSTTGVSTMQWIMNGRYLQQSFQGQFMGAPFEGIGYTGYDNVKKQYWGTWMDNTATYMMTTAGTGFDGKTWTYNATMSDPMTGKDSLSRETITIVDADHHKLEIWGPGPDGKDFKMMEINYSRKK